ncbi:MAG: GNAT family N-acetyltransferase [Baekduia sp.]
MPEAAGLLVRSWARSYSDIVAPDEHPDADGQARHLRTPGAAGWVFEQGGAIAAVALVLGHGSGDPELSVLHVDPPAQGAGVGGRLHDAVLESLRSDGTGRCHLFVFEANEQARAFYAARGWTEAEAREIPARCGSAPVMRLDRVL